MTSSHPLRYDNAATRSNRLWLWIAALFLFCFSQILIPIKLEAQTVASAHPRVWLTPSRLSLLKTFAARNTPRWQKVKAAADFALTSSNATIWGDDGAGVELGLAYQVTGNAAYAQRDIQLLTAEAVSSNDLSQGGAWWGYRYLPDYIAAYDWCYDQMTTAQRQQVAKWLMDRADAVWPETNPSRAGGWGLWPSNNYYWGYMFTAPAAFAAYGDDPTTSGTKSAPNRPLYHINLGLKHWNNDVVPWANSWGVGGMFAESTGYDATFYMGMFTDSYLTGGSTDLTNNGGTSFVRDSILWRIHSTTPTLNQYYPLGDRPGNAGGWLGDFDRWRMCIPMTDTQDTTAQSYAKTWLNSISPNLDTSRIMCGYDFLYYNEDAPSGSYTSLPLWYYASGPGILLRRSNWTTTASYFGIWAGSLEEAHQDFDVNGFQIFKGSWLAGAASLWSNTGEIEDTGSHNNLTFGNAGQTWQNPGNGDPSEAGWMLKQENTSEYSYFAGQAAPAYRVGGSNPVSDYVRKFVYLPGDEYVVLDRVKLGNPATTKEWHIQSENAPVISGRNFTITNGSYQLNGQSLLPASGVTLAKVSMSSITGGNSSGYRVDVKVADNTASDFLLHVMQLTSAGTVAVPAQLITATTGNMYGAFMPSNGYLVMCGTSELVKTTVTYSETSAIVTHHLVLDLTPSTNYQITTTSQTDGSVTTINQTTSNVGSLRFDVPAGGYTVSVLSNNVQLPATLNSLALSPASVAGGTSSQGTVTLSAAAPAGGITLTLSSDNNTVTIPANVTVAAGATTANYLIYTTAVTADTNVNLSATFSGITKTAVLTVQAPVVVSLSSLAVSPASVSGGTSSTGTVTLSAAAPTGGTTVTLSSSSTSAVVPANVIVASGAKTAAFTITTKAVTADTAATITAVSGGLTKTTILTVQAPVPATLSTLTVTPGTVPGGTSAIGTVTLTNAAPAGGTTVTLSSNNTAATVPASISVAAGAKTLAFSITTTKVTTNTSVTITAVGGGVTKTAALTVQNSSVTLNSLTFSPSTVTGGGSAVGTLTLSGPAPIGGSVITLLSSSGSVIVPISVTVASGASSVSFTAATGVVTTGVTATITAGLSGTSKAATLAVQPVLNSGGFVMGTAFGGPSVTIEGNKWLSYSSALSKGFSQSGGSLGQTWNVTYLPSPDSNTKTMLNNGLWKTGTANGVGFTLSQTLANGSYQVYLWEVEDGSNHSRNMNVILQGSTVATGIGDQLVGHWSKYGPYPATVTNGILTLKLVRGTKGDPQAMGIAIFKN